VRPQLLIAGKKIPAHPVYFPRRYGYALSKLTGDNGAKKLIQQQILFTDLNGESIKENLLIDVDTQEILDTLHKQNERSI
jgi:CTP:molybdopterin cytidylyltransferase MocA